MRNYAVINIGSSFKQTLWILGSVMVNLVYWTCFNYFVLSAVLVLVLGVQSEKPEYSDNVASASSVVTATKVLFILQIPNGE